MAGTASVRTAPVTNRARANWPGSTPSAAGRSSRMRVVCVRASATGMTVTFVAVTLFPIEAISTRTGSVSFSFGSAACGSVAVTRRSRGSNTVTSGRPGCAMSPSSASVAPTTPAYGAVIVLNDCAATACPAFAFTAASCACAALYSASDWSTAAWLTNFCARRSRLRSCLRFALARFASASATCDRLAATAWSAVRASMRASTCPARTVSPALTFNSTMRPATCAPRVVCFTASTTPSAAMVCAKSRTTTSSVGPTPGATGVCCATAGDASASAAASASHAKPAPAPPATATRRGVAAVTPSCRS